MYTVGKYHGGVPELPHMTRFICYLLHDQDFQSQLLEPLAMFSVSAATSQLIVILGPNRFMQTKLYSFANVIESLGKVMGRSRGLHG